MWLLIACLPGLIGEVLDFSTRPTVLKDPEDRILSRSVEFWTEIKPGIEEIYSRLHQDGLVFMATLPDISLENVETVSESLIGSLDGKCSGLLWNKSHSEKPKKYDLVSGGLNEPMSELYRSKSDNNFSFSWTSNDLKVSVFSKSSVMSNVPSLTESWSALLERQSSYEYIFTVREVWKEELIWPKLLRVLRPDAVDIPCLEHLIRHLFQKEVLIPS